MARGESSEAFDGLHVPRRTRRLFLAVSLLTLAVYLVSARGVPQTFDEQIVFDTTAALVHGHAAIKSTSVSAAEFKVFPGLSVHRSDGSRAGIYGIGTSAVGAPFFVIGKVVAEMSPPENRTQITLTATMFTDALITAAAMFMLMLVCMLLGAPPPGAVIVGLAYGLGSYAFPHALTLFTEPGTALCVIAAVYFAMRAARCGARSDLLACGAWAGAALLFRVSAVLFLPVIGLWLLFAAWRRADAADTSARVLRMVRFGAWFTAGAAGPLLVMLAVNGWRYGSITNFGYGIGDATDQSYPILRGVVNQWFSSGKSVFLYAPVAIVVVCGLVRSVKRMPMEMALLGSIVVVNTLFFARVQFWSGDWAWGPRYLQIVIPCLAAMAAPLMDSPAWRRALIVAAGLGLLFAALPAVLVRFTPLFYAAYAAMPPPTIQGPKVWDHSYYALVWHTWHWQPILYQLRSLPHALSNSFDHVTSPLGPNPLNAAGIPRSPNGPRVELWWLRARDLGWTAVFMFALLPLAAAVVGARLLVGYRKRGPEAVSGPAGGVSGAV